MCNIKNIDGKNYIDITDNIKTEEFRWKLVGVPATPVDNKECEYNLNKRIRLDKNWFEPSEIMKTDIQDKLNNDYLYLEDKFGLNKVSTKGMLNYCTNNTIQREPINTEDLKKFLEITSINFPSSGFILKGEEIKTFEQSEFRWKIQ